jgi:hypothetical protein
MTLRELNFQDLINVGVPNINSYTFDVYRKNNYQHKPINGYCIACEQNGFNLSTDDDSYRLTNISHGAQTSDFLLSAAVKTNLPHQEGVMFVYETPSRDYDIYQEVEYMGFKKRPSIKWYWLNTKLSPVSYPDQFVGGVYGEFVLSAILTFGLANAYMTNLVKCGMNNNAGKFKGINFYKKECIEKCYDQFLKKEIDILKPVVIFGVGSAVYNRINEFVKDSGILVQQLPHPAGRRRGFRDEHYKTLYFWLIVTALHKTKIIQSSEADDLARLFIARF